MNPNFKSGKTYLRAYSMTEDKSILIKNIYYMLAYAFGTFKSGEYENIETEKFDNIHNLFAALLSKGIGKQLKQGLYREYLNQKEDLAVVRGKIDLTGSIKNLVSKKQVLTCEYDVLSENNLLNRIVKTTVFLLLKKADVEQKYKDTLKKEMLYFSNVDTIDLRTVRWSSIRFQRGNNSYRILIGICWLIIEGMLLTTDNGDYRLSSVINERPMHQLYEKFLLGFYAKECPQVKTSSSEISWALDDENRFLLPTMQSDVMLSKGNTVLIIDAKYYGRIMMQQFNVSKLRSAHLYQIFSYVKNKDAEFAEQNHSVSGMLLYASTREAIQPDCTYMMSGNKISVRTLDLNKDFSVISSYLKAIVEGHFGE